MIDPIIYFSKEEFNMALDRAEDAVKRLKNDNYNSNSQLENSLVGFLGEIAFKKLLDKYGYYYNTDEEELVKESLINSDLGDFFGSKTEHSIDIKTTINKQRKELHLMVNKDKLKKNQNIDSYVQVEIYLKDDIKGLYFENIEYAEVKGAIHSKTLLQDKYTKTLYGRVNQAVLTSQLSNIKEFLEKEFYKKTEYAYRMQNVKIKYMHRDIFKENFLKIFGKKYRILHFYSMDGRPLIEPLVKDLDMKRFNLILRHNNNHSKLSKYAKFRELRGFRSDETGVYYNHSWVEENGEILTQTLVRSLRKAAKNAENEDKILFVPINRRLYEVVEKYVENKYNIVFIHEEEK